MLSARLPSALDSGLFVLPETGDILVFAPGADTDLSALPKDRVLIIDDFYPDCKAWENQGYRVEQDLPEQAAAAVICMPRAKSLARKWVAEASACVTGPIAIDGSKTSGIESILKSCKELTPVSQAFSRAHGKLFTLLPTPERAAVFTPWHAGMAEGPDGFITAPGVFSESKVDKGSAILAAALPERPGRRIADLGAGWGYLSARMLKNADIETVHLIEASKTALTCARENISDERAQFHWGDARKIKLPEPVDVVVTNPPFHVGRAAEPTLGQAFLTNAAELLTPKGTLWVVANQGLPYEATLKELFRIVDQVVLESGFKVLKAMIPNSRSRSKR